MNHQLAGTRLYSANPLVSRMLNAAARVLMVSALLTVVNPKGASCPSQIRIVPAYTASRMEYVVIVAAAVREKKLLTVALNSVVKMLVKIRQKITWRI